MPWSLFRRPHPDPVVRAYEEATPRRPVRGAAVEATRFAVLDAETTGFDIARDRMLSLATIAVVGGQIEVNTTRTWLIRQPRLDRGETTAGATDAVAVHGILPSESAAGTPEIEVLRELLPVIAGAVIVGHHVRFDAAMIHAALRRHLGTGLRNPLIDTAHLAMSALEAFRKSGYANQRPPALEEVCAQCGIDPVARHTAVGDAFTTAEVLLLLAARLRRRARTRTLRLSDLGVVRF